MELICPREKKFATDARTKLFFVVAVSIFSFTAPNAMVLLWNYGVVLAILLFDRNYGLAVKGGAFCVAVLGLEFLAARYLAGGMFKQMFLMFFFMAQRVLPLALMAAWLTSTLRISDFVTALQQMRVPKGFTITLAVALRFIPTVNYEFHAIKNTMKLRGVGFSVKNILQKPLRTMEYALVPLVLRSMKVADELAASTMTRGLDRPEKRSSLREVRFRPQDFLLCALLLAVLLLGLFFNDLLSKGGRL